VVDAMHRRSERAVVGGAARRAALEVLARVDGGAWTQVALASVLDPSGLDEPDRALAARLAKGSIRMARACDWLVDGCLADAGRTPPAARRALRLGAYQLAFGAVPRFAAIDTTVAATPPRWRGLVNAVLRKVADRLQDGVAWPTEAVHASVPDWIFERAVADLGAEGARRALAAMNDPGPPALRADGFRQGEASLWVVDVVGPRPGSLVVDCCAAPGGKASALAGRGAEVVALEVAGGRARAMARLVGRLGVSVGVVRADATAPPLREGAADAVLVDAPCSGLFTLGRRPDLRWRADPASPARLSRLQRELLGAAARLVRPGGRVVYSVCTFAAEETTAVDTWLADAHPELVAEAPGGVGEPWGRGALCWPEAGGADGMFVLVLRRREAGSGKPGGEATVA
jgi:16S rRNA (cytosine967-C5)-methyltransferase